MNFKQGYFEYKNHVSVDVKYKFIRSYAVTDAAVHDCQMIETLLDRSDNANTDVYADSAYRSEAIADYLETTDRRDCIHRKGYRNYPLGQRSRQANRKKSRWRARVEHVFGRQVQFGGKLMRGTGLVRTKTWIGFKTVGRLFVR